MLKAKVMIIGYVDGVRTGFHPGEEVVGLHPHDVEELKKVGALEDEADTARADRQAAAAERTASKDFEQAREKVQSAQESIVVPQPAGDDGKAPASKGCRAGKK